MIDRISNSGDTLMFALRFCKYNIAIFTCSLLFAFDALGSNVPILKDDKLYQCDAKISHIKMTDGKIFYQYNFSLTNKSDESIGRFHVGEKSRNEWYDPGIKAEYKDMYQMTTKQPIGWQGEVYISEWPVVMFAWDLTDESKSNLAIVEKFTLPKKSTSTAFSATSPIRLKNIFDTFALVDGPNYSYYNFPIQNGDKTPPTGTVTALPPLIASGIAQIEFKVDAKDNYDPLPQISFEGITQLDDAGNSLGPARLNPFGVGYMPVGIMNNDPVYGKFPNKFKFIVYPTKDLKYKINYKITDGAGNTTDVSTVFVIPKKK